MEQNKRNSIYQHYKTIQKPKTKPTTFYSLNTSKLLYLLKTNLNNNSNSPYLPTQSSSHLYPYHSTNPRYILSCPTISAPMTTINHLPDAIVVKLFEHLGLTPTLTAPALARLAPAFSLALTNTRFMKIFCESCIALDTSLQPASAEITFVPYAFFPPSLEQSLVWFLRHGTRIRSAVLVSMACLPPFMDLLPNLQRLRHLHFSREILQEDQPLRFPKSIESLTIEAPTPFVLSSITFDNFPRLRSLSLIHIDTAHLDHLHDLLSRCSSKLRKLSLSFAVCCQCKVGIQDSKTVTRFLSQLARSESLCLPNVEDFNVAIAPTFLTTKENDTVIFRRRLNSFLSKIRNRCVRNASPCFPNLRKLSLTIDSRHADAWPRALSSIIFNPSVSVTLSLGMESVTIAPRGDLFYKEKLCANRFAVQFFDEHDEHPFPTHAHLRDQPVEQVHISRAVLDRIYVDEMYARRTCDLLKASPSINELHVHACFAQLSSSYIIPADCQEAEHVIEKIKQLDEREANVTASAHLALNRVLRNLSCIIMLRFKLDFAHAFMTHNNPKLLEETLASVPNLESLILILPSRTQDGAKYSGIVTPTLLDGMSHLLKKLYHTCPLLKYITVDISSDAMIGHCPSFQTKVALRDALIACDSFSEFRPDVECHPLRGLLELWEDSFYSDDC